MTVTHKEVDLRTSALEVPDALLRRLKLRELTDSLSESEACERLRVSRGCSVVRIHVVHMQIAVLSQISLSHDHR